MAGPTTRAPLAAWLLVAAAAGLILARSIPASWWLLSRHFPAGRTAQAPAPPVQGIPKECVVDTYGGPRGESRTHEGVDIFARRGTPVVSMVDGVVVELGRDVYGGNVIRVLGRDRRIYYYAHLDRFAALVVGAPVARGQELGSVGNTGNAVSSPPHVHLEIMEMWWPFPPWTRSVNPFHELP